MSPHPTHTLILAFCGVTTTFFATPIQAQTLFNDATGSAVGMPRHSIILVADLDNNGVDDLVVSSEGVIQLWKRQTGLSYTDSSAGSGLQGLEPVSAGDFNNDGSVDFLHVNGARTEAAFYRNAGNGTFTKLAIPATESTQLFGFQDSVRAVDIDSDGDLDVVFGKALGSGGSIVAVLNQSRNGGSADQPFSGITTLAVTSWIHNKAEVTDANGDGKPDLLSIRTAGNWSSGTHPDYPVTLFLNTGNAPADYLNPDAAQNLAGFAQRDNCGISAANVMSPLATWDIDNDGDLDLINGSSDWPWTSRPHIYINDGAGNYTQMNSPVYQSSNYYHHWISIFDADLDNDMDAVWTGLHNFSDTYPRMWRNDGNLTFNDVTSAWGITARIPGSGNHGMGGYHADLDGDGDLDFVVDIANGWGSEQVFSIYRNEAVQNGANWLGVKLVAEDSAPHGIGARVEVTANGKKLLQYMADLNGGVRSFSPLLFGLGASTNANTLKVYWPSGSVTELQNVQGGRIVQLTENHSGVNSPKLLFTAFRGDLDGPIGVDYDPLDGSLVASVSYPSGQPHNLVKLYASGDSRVYTGLSGLSEELKLATVKTSIGGFSRGELFFGNGQDGQIVRVSGDGQRVQNPWVDLPGGGNGLFRGSLYHDDTGLFGGDLIAVTTAGQVWRVNSAGAATKLADLGTHLEGLCVVPQDVAKYGPLAGKILVGAEGQGLLYTIDTNAVVVSYNVDVAIEDIDIVPPGQDFYGVDYANRRILKADRSNFAGLLGEIVLAQEGIGSSGSGLYRLFWDGSAVRAQAIGLEAGSLSPAQWEHVTFADLKPAAPPDTDGDGIPDAYETNTGFYVSPTDTGTDPNNPDSDGDTLPDGVETASYIYIDATDTGTDPNLPDTDGDGLSDNVETNTGIYVSATDTGTSPVLDDTSGDGITDGEAVAAQFNPLIDQRPVLNFLTQAVAAQPNRFGFYNEANVMHLGMGGLMIRKSGSAVNIDLQWQTKISLTDAWTNHGAPLPFFLNLPGSKAFIRLQATPGAP